MAILTVTASTDYTSQTLSNIDGITYSTSGSALAIFSSNQFGAGQISNSVIVIGDAFENLLMVNLAASGVFSAAAWSFSGWNAAVDRILLNGSSGADILTGTSQADVLTGGDGADAMSGGGGNDTFAYTSPVHLDPGESVTGGAGTDTLQLTSGGAANGYSFNNATVSGIERLVLTDKVFAIFDGSAFAPGNISAVVGSGGADRIDIQNATSVNLSAVSFTSWGPDAEIFIFGTSGSDTITGSAGIDRIFGNTGADILNGGNGNDDFRYSSAADPASGESVNGGAGNDAILLFGSGTFDFSGVAVTGVEALGFSNFLSATTARFLGTHLGAGKIAAIAGNFDPNHLIVDGTTDLSGVAFTSWTNGADTITLNGTSGADTIAGSSQNDVVAGALGNDILRGHGGEDVVRGGPGNDQIDGGDATDRAEFSTALANYQLHVTKSGGVVSVLVKDGVGTDGNDKVTRVETLRFSDGDVTSFAVQQNLESNVAGTRFDDVVYRSIIDGQVIFQRMNAGAPQGFDAVTNLLTVNYKAIGTGDVTGDGKADVFIWNTGNGQVLTAAPGASGAPTYAVIANGIAGSFAAVGVADIDGDGFTDLLVRDGSTGTIYWQAMANGAPGAWGLVGVNLGSAWSYRGAGDINGDSFADVVIQHTSGQVYVANMANGVNSGYFDLGNISGFAVRAVADVNGDGNDDLIVQHQSDGQTLWYNAFGTGPIWNVGSSPMGTQWIVRGAADIDHDHRAEALFQHTSTGQTLAKDLTEAPGTGWGIASSALGTEWVVI